jgi:hypothetical protein
MKRLYISKDNDLNVINDFMFEDKVIYCTLLSHERVNIRFQFIVASYNFKQLIANIPLSEAKSLKRWRNIYLPGIETIVNIYDDDCYEALYELGTDHDLDISCTFYKDIKQLFYTL